MNKKIRISMGIAAIVLAVGCASISEYSVASTPRAVGADLAITIEKTDTGNFMVNMEAQFLSPPDRIGEGMTVFVVWFETNDQLPQRMGLLAYDPDSREGAMAATTTLRNFEIVITAELSPEVTTPGEAIVFQQLVNSPD